MQPNRPVRLVRATELAEGQRVLKEVFGRSVTLLRQGGKVFCVDTFCSHQGGPLGELGDLEELSDGTACIKCPWHNFRFDLQSGCRVEKGLCPDEQLRSEPQQRMHPVYNDGDWIWVDLKTQGTMASDAYNDHSSMYESAGLSAKQQVPPQLGWGLGLDEFLPSSQESSATAFNSSPPPLTPYAGTDRRPLPPSPVKMAPLQPPQPQLPAQQPSAAEISFPGRKLTAAALRRAKATQAIRNSSYGPPSVPNPLPAAQPKRARQATVTDLFGRHSALQQPSTLQQPPYVHDDMNMS